MPSPLALSLNSFKEEQFVMGNNKKISKKVFFNI